MPSMPRRKGQGPRIPTEEVVRWASWLFPGLDDLVRGVERRVFERGDLARGPTHQHALYGLGCSHPHEDSRIVRRHEAVPAFREAVDHSSTGVHLDLRAPIPSRELRVPTSARRIQ